MQNADTPTDGLLNSLHTDDSDSLAEIMREKHDQHYLQERQNAKENNILVTNGETIENKTEHNSVDIDKHSIQNDIANESLKMDVDDNESVVLTNDNSKKIIHNSDSNEVNSNELVPNQVNSNELVPNEMSSNKLTNNMIPNDVNSYDLTNNIDSNEGNSNEITSNLVPSEVNSNDLTNSMDTSEVNSNELSSNSKLNEVNSNEMNSNLKLVNKDDQEIKCFSSNNGNMNSNGDKFKEDLETFEDKVGVNDEKVEGMNGNSDLNVEKNVKQFRKTNNGSEIQKNVQKLSKKIDSVIVKLKENKQEVDRGNEVVDLKSVDRNMNSILKNSAKTDANNLVNGCLRVEPKPIATIVIDSDTEMDDGSEKDGPVMDLTVKNKTSNDKMLDLDVKNDFKGSKIVSETKVDDYANHVDVNKLDVASAKNSDSIVNKKVSIMGATLNKRKSTKPMKDLTSYFKKLPPDVKAMVDDVERKSIEKVEEKPAPEPTHSANRLFPIFSNRQTRSTEKSGKMMEIANTVMQNLAACGTQISFSSGRAPETTRAPQASPGVSHKPDLSIFLKDGSVNEEEEEAPQDLSLNKKKSAPAINLNHDFTLKKSAVTTNSKDVSKPPQVSKPKPDMAKLKTETVSSPSDALTFSPVLDSQLTKDNTVIEVPSFYSPFVIAAPSKENFKDCLKQLNKTIDDEKTAESVDNTVTDDEDEKATMRIVEEISKENPNDKYKDYFQSTLGKFFVEIGFNLVQEYVQKDLLQSQASSSRHNKRTKILQSDLVSLEKSYDATRKRNAAYKWQLKKCDYCDYKSESETVIRKHLETPHLIKSNYCCNFCSFQTNGRSMNDVHHHMIKEHNVTPAYEKQSNMECQNCEFSCKTKKSLEKHVAFCVTNFNEATNLVPDSYWEPPVKLTKVLSQPSLLNTHVSLDSLKTLSKTDVASSGVQQRLGNSSYNDLHSMLPPAAKTGTLQTKSSAGAPSRSRSGSRGIKKINPIENTAIIAAQMSQLIGSLCDEKDPKRISETIQKLQILEALTKASSIAAPDVVTCEICDGFLNGKAELRNHLMMMHHVKIHPRMLNQRPNLSCEKCEHRFYTDQGLERHLLGKHGLVSKMLQNAACTGQDAGRCPICGKYLAGGLLAHVSDIHQTVLRPAFLSYKCTVCTATFPAYSLFETHVYSEHKTVLPS